MASNNGITLEAIEREELRRKNLGNDYKPYESPNTPKANNNEINPFMAGVQGFNTGVERLTHGLMQPFLQGNPVFENAVRQREEGYTQAHEQHPGATFAGELSGNIGAGLPFGGVGAKAASYAGKIPKVGQAIASSPYLKEILGSTLGGGLMGGSEYVGPNESRLGNAAGGASIGGAFGAASPIFRKGGEYVGKGLDLGKDALKAAYSSVLRGFGSEHHILKDMLKRYSNKEISEALKNQEYGKKLGVKLTPAEAGKSEIGGKYEGNLGDSVEGERKLYDFKKGQKEAQKESIESLANKIHPSNENASEETRKAAQNVIKKKEKALRQRAKPYYKAAENKIIPPNTLNKLTKDGNIEKAWKQVLEDPKYKADIEGYAPNSIKVLDRVKKKLDGDMKAALRSGNSDDVRLLKLAKDKLVKELDKVSPEYKKARSIYSTESPLIDLVRNREVGKIAKLKDTQLKNVSNIIFDPKQTDPKVMARLRDEISKENPNAWAKLVRNAMENKLPSVNLGTTEQHGTNFYRKILADDKTYNLFHSSLKGNTEAQKRLEMMKSVYKDLVNKPTVKGAHALAQSNVDKSRSSAQYWKKMLHAMNGGKFDKAAVEIITNDKWQKAFFDAMQERSMPKKEAALIKLLQKVDLSKPAKALKGGAIGMATSTNEPYLKTKSGYEVYKND